MKIKQKLMVLTCITALFLSACDNSTPTPISEENNVVATAATGEQQTIKIEEKTGDQFDAADLYNDFDKSKSEVVTLAEGKITSDGSSGGVAINGTTITLTKGGNYYFTGSCADGKIVVNSANDENVRIILDNASLTNTKGCVLYIKKAKKTIVTVADGSSNMLSDSGDFSGEEKGIAATVYSQGDLTFNGVGQLSLVGNYQDAVSCSADLKITAGTLNVQCKKDGIVAAKGVSIKNGAFSMQCGGDGIKTTSATEKEGFIGVESGNYNITAGNNILKATGTIYFLNGGFNGTAGGGSAVSSKDSGWGNFGEKDLTAKGLKAGGDIEIYGGSLNFDTADDTLYAGKSIVINNGCVIASSGDDAMVSDKGIEVNGGSITLSKCYTGFESTNVNLVGGYIDVTAAGDGINAANGKDGSALEKRPGMNEFKRGDKGEVKINNTCINVKAEGDGIDVDGTVSIDGGAVRLRSSEDGAYSTIDCTGKYEVKGGTVITAGNEDEMLAPADSSQSAVCFTYPEKQAADSVVCLKDSKGQTLMAFCMGSSYHKAMISLSDFKEGSTYKWYKAKLKDGQTPAFGDVQEDAYEVGDQIAEFKLSTGVIQVSENTK